MMLEQVPYHLIRGAQTADGGWTFKVWTPELTPEQVLHMVGLGQQPGWFLVKPNELKLEDVPVNDAPVESGSKTPGQRLRAVLYVLWEANGSQGDFETYYAKQMEKLIGAVKERINP